MYMYFKSKDLAVNLMVCVGIVQEVPLSHHPQQRPPFLIIGINLFCLLTMYLLLAFTKCHLSNVASFLENRVALIERDYCNVDNLLYFSHVHVLMYFSSGHTKKDDLL